MTRLRSPGVWLPLTLLALTALGTALLYGTHATRFDARDLDAYWARSLWQTAFDALSAACGCGLLTHPFEDGHTDFGRWTLVLLGFAGALSYVLAAAQVAHKLRVAGSGANSRRWWLPVAVFVVGQIVALPIALIGQRAAQGSETSFDLGVCNAVAAYSSLGWSAAPAGGVRAAQGMISVLGALGWAPFLLLFARGHADMRAVRRVAFGYLLFLVAAALVVLLLETPRGATAPGGATLSTTVLDERVDRIVALVANAAGAGIPTETLSDRGVSEGAKVVLAFVVLAGGMGGAAGGGMKWPLLLLALSAAFAAFRRTPSRPVDPGAIRLRAAAVACVAAVLSLALVVALGLLALETLGASRFASPPTFADALVDAASAVGGAALTSGLSATVTSPNLSSGIRLPVDQYQYGMAWLMLAMLAGRVLPLVVLHRWAAARIEPGVRAPALLV